LAVLTAIEGLASMGSGMSARRTHIVKELVQAKVDQVAITGKKAGGRRRRQRRRRRPERRRRRKTKWGGKRKRERKGKKFGKIVVRGEGRP
jgi:hypothetical protein